MTARWDRSMKPQRVRGRWKWGLLYTLFLFLWAFGKSFFIDLPDPWDWMPSLVAGVVLYYTIVTLARWDWERIEEEKDRGDHESVEAP